MVIEVGEWGDCGGIRCFVVDDDGEPEPEFAEPHGHRRDIDAEDRVGEDVSAQLGDGAGIAELCAECGELLEGGDENAAGAAGGVEYSYRIESRKNFSGDCLRHCGAIEHAECKCAEFRECVRERIVDE